MQNIDTEKKIIELEKNLAELKHELKALQFYSKEQFLKLSEHITERISQVFEEN